MMREYYMNGVIGEINYQGFTWMGDKWVTDVLSMITFLDHKKRERDR